MPQKNKNISVIIERGEIYEKFSVYRNKIYAYSSRDCKGIICKYSYGLQTDIFWRIDCFKSKSEKASYKS